MDNCNSGYSGDSRSSVPLPSAQSVKSLRTTGQRFSPEFELLLACCTAASPPAARIVELPSDLDWTAVLEMADHHGVLPFLYRALAEHAADLPIWANLQKRLEDLTRRALWLTQLLQRTLRLLHDRHISALPYKGPVLAQTLYGDIAFRQYTDLDILIRTQDLTRATAALAEVGLTPHLHLRVPEQKAYLASGYECTFDGFGNANLVELQWRILPRFYAVDFNMDGLFQRAVTMDFSGTTVQTLAPEDLFLVLCVHAAKHLWARLSWIMDIARLCGSENMNWDRVKVDAKQLGITRMVGVSLRLGQELFRQPVPAILQDAVRDGEVDRVIKAVIARLVAAEQVDTESVAYFRQAMRLRERAGDKWRFVSRLAKTPSLGEWQAVSLPKSLFPLYRVVRLFRLVRRLG
jgi:Uncharacterised nucleotidyltransferase